MNCPAFPRLAWPAVITFDCYGTLVQWPEALRAYFATLLPAGSDAAAFHADFNRHHMAEKAGKYRPFSVIICDALAMTMAQWHLGNVEAAQDGLLLAIREIQPYPEVVPVLQSLAQRFRLAIISNTEDRMLAGVLATLQVPFELVTAQQGGAYKPDPYLFRFAFRQLGVAPESVLHVAAGNYTDMWPAFELGLARVWINRRSETADPLRPPSAELPDLTGLEAVVDCLVAARQPH